LLLGANKFGEGVIVWLINNVHVVVEGLWTYIWPLLSLILFISSVSLLELGFPFLCWLRNYSYVYRFDINELLWRLFFKFFFKVDLNYRIWKKNTTLTKVYLMTIGLHILYLVSDITQNLLLYCFGLKVLKPIKINWY
jgi:hypothetical protein